MIDAKPAHVRRLEWILDGLPADFDINFKETLYDGIHHLTRAYEIKEEAAQILGFRNKPAKNFYSNLKIDIPSYDYAPIEECKSATTLDDSIINENFETLSTACSDIDDEEVLPELMEAISLCDNTTMLNLQRTVPTEPLSSGLKRMTPKTPRNRKRLLTRRASTFRDLDTYETSQISFM